MIIDSFVQPLLRTGVSYMLYMGSIMCVCVCVCVFSHFSHVQLFATLWTIVCQAPLSMGFSRQEYSSGLPCPSLEDFPTCISYVSCIGRYVLYHQCYLRSPSYGCLPLNTDSGSLGMSLIHLITFSEIGIIRKSYKYNVCNLGCLLACAVFFFTPLLHFLGETSKPEAKFQPVQPCVGR